MKKQAFRDKLNFLVMFYRARRAAKKYNLDFEHNCCFDEQLRSYTRFPETGRVVEVNMESGKIGLYKMIQTKRRSTGQNGWRFEFQGYKT